VATGRLSPFFQYDDETGIHSPVFAQDGETIYFRAFKWHHLITVRNYKIVRFESSTKAQDVLFTTEPESAVYLYELELSPDENQISFFTQCINPVSTVLYVMPSTGGEAREVIRYSPPESVVDHDWAPDGRSIILAVANRKTLMSKFYQVSPETGETRYLGLETDDLWSFSVAPDGNRLAFSAGQARREVWVMDNFIPNQKRVGKTGPLAQSGHRAP
jgi:Tol biopolymer transport system component